MESARGHEITIDQSTTPAGWYADPAGSGGKRWWDGVQWTTHMQAAAPPPPPQPQFQAQPAAMVLHQPQQIDPQRVDPYAASNPYGLPAVQERPYVPMQHTTLPPVAMGEVHQASNGAAIGSVVVGAVAFCLSLVGLIPGSPVFYYSVGGVFAIVGGARALARQRRGFGTSRIAPVAAIILGSLAVLFMVIGVLIHTTLSSSVNYGTNGSQSQTGTTSGSTTGALPTAPSFSTDATLTRYEASAGQLATSIYATYNGGQVSTGAVPAQWPGALMESTDGVVSFPSGTAAATLPNDEVVKYVLSSDGKYFVVAVTGGTHQEVAIYDSQDNVFTWVCDTGAPATCPSGGLDPNSSGDTTSDS